MDTAAAEIQSPELGLGEEVGHYRLLRSIGEGGMGRVFLAEHTSLGTRSAVKVLRPELAQQPETARRFLREAKLAASLRHPHIVQVFDCGETRGGLYYVMELLEGSHLAKLRETRGAFSLPRTISVGWQVAKALSWVHGKGIIHRDLTPENIFLVQHPEPDFVKILDFGIAKLTSAGGLTLAGPGTQLGMILGTPEFMSPEQAGGRAIDSRSDIYSLGIVLYWMLTDRVPLMGNSFGELVARRERETPELLGDRTAFGDPLPQEIRKLVTRCLARDPEERPRRAEEIAAVFSEWRRTEGAPVRTEVLTAEREVLKPRLTNRLAAVGIVSAGLAGILALAISSTGSRIIHKIEQPHAQQAMDAPVLVVPDFPAPAAPSLALTPKVQPADPDQHRVKPGVRNAMAEQAITRHLAPLLPVPSPPAAGKRRLPAEVRSPAPAPRSRSAASDAPRPAQPARRELDLEDPFGE